MSEAMSKEYPASIFLIALAFRWHAVEQCMVSNDAGCFSVEQYQAAYDEQSGKEFVEKHMPYRWQPGLAERHLQSLASCGVREVRPGVWTVEEATP